MSARNTTPLLALVALASAALRQPSKADDALARHLAGQPHVEERCSICRAGSGAVVSMDSKAVVTELLR